jgi:PKHD-type hydroxylase
MIALPSVLGAQEIEEILLVLNSSDFKDGKKTAGYRARRVKNNLQLERKDKERVRINKIVRDGLNRSELFRMAVIPKIIKTPMFSRYTEGMEYGFHVDDALMNKPDTIRSDLSATIFLSRASDYDGGELVTRSHLGEQMIKLNSGDAILYASSTLHRVRPITRGERIVAITWVQSFVRDPDKRELLFDLHRVRKAMHENMQDHTETETIFKSHANLLRMWAEL